MAVARGIELADVCLLKLAALAYDVVDTRLQVRHAERLGYIVVDALVKAFYAVVDGGSGRQHHYRYVACVGTCLYLAYHGHAVHHGHHDVGDDEVGLAALRHLESFLPVACLKHIVARRKTAYKEVAQLNVVFNHEHGDAS